MMEGHGALLAGKAGEIVYEEDTLKTKHLLTNTILDIEGGLAVASR